MSETFVGRVLRVRRPQATNRRVLVELPDSTCGECGREVEGRAEVCRWCRARFVELGRGDPAQLALVDGAIRSDVVLDGSPRRRVREILKSPAAHPAQLPLFLAGSADIPPAAPAVEEADTMDEQDTPIVAQLRKDVTEASVLLSALAPGDELVGYQTTLIIRRSTGELDTAHAAVASESLRHEVGSAIREATVKSWPE